MPPPAALPHARPPLRPASPIQPDRPRRRRRRRRRLPLASPAAGHPANPHTRAPLDADALVVAHPHLAAYLVPGRQNASGGGGGGGIAAGIDSDGGGGDGSGGGGCDGDGGDGDGHRGGSRRSLLDLTSPGAIEAVTVAQLSSVWGLKWTVPPGTLIPVLPSRADYLLWASGLSDAVPVAPSTDQGGGTAVGGSPSSPVPPTWALVDVGTGASVIYPLLATRLFPDDRRILGVDADIAALAAAAINVDANALGDRITLRPASRRGSGDAVEPPDWGLASDETAALTVCNPPFYDLDESPAAGVAGGAPAARHPHRSPTGGAAQLAVAGGEAAFVSALIKASAAAAHRVGWFTTLTGKKATAVAAVAALRSAGVPRVVAAAFQYRRTGRWYGGWGKRWGGGAAVTRATLVVDVGATCGGVGAADVTAAALVMLREAGWMAVGVGSASGSGGSDEEAGRRSNAMESDLEPPPPPPELEVVATPGGGVTTNGAVTLVVKRVRAGERLLAEAVRLLVSELTDLLSIRHGDEFGRDEPDASGGAPRQDEAIVGDPTGQDVLVDKDHGGAAPGGDNCSSAAGGTGPT
ncbi:hypothetical protein MMPV_003490 [Pyropia vietnamensis]